MSRFKTVWDLMGDWSWMDDHKFKLKNGRTIYTDVGYDCSRNGKNVMVGRLESTEHGIKQVKRYVHPDTEVVLIPVEKSNRGEQCG